MDAIRSDLLCKFFKKNRSCASGDACRHCHSREEVKAFRVLQSKLCIAANAAAAKEGFRNTREKNIVAKKQKREAEALQAKVHLATVPEGVEDAGAKTNLDPIDIRQLVNDCADGFMRGRQNNWADMMDGDSSEDESEPSGADMKAIVPMLKSSCFDWNGAADSSTDDGGICDRSFSDPNTRSDFSGVGDDRM